MVTATLYMFHHTHSIERTVYTFTVLYLIGGDRVSLRCWVVKVKNVHNPTSVDLDSLLSGQEDLARRNTAQGEVVAMDQTKC